MEPAVNGRRKSVSDRRFQRAFPTATNPLTPDMVIEMVRLTAPGGVIAVQGIAESVSKPWSRDGSRPVVFGELSLGGANLSFQVPAEMAPASDERVVIEGYLRASPVTRSFEGRRGNWKIMLVGQVVGTWTPRETPPPPSPLPDRGEATPLDIFIETHGIEKLLILATEVGQADITNELVKARIEARPQFLRANFGNPDAFLQVLSTIKQGRGIQGLAVARGGGLGLDVIGSSRDVVAALIDKGVPFYAALGHAVNIELLDRYADQAFHSPTALGSAIGRSIMAGFRRTSQARETTRQADLIASQTVRISELEHAVKQKEESWQSRTTTLRNAIIVLAAVTAILVWISLR